jgi:hypothetical protein
MVKLRDETKIKTEYICKEKGCGEKSWEHWPVCEKHAKEHIACFPKMEPQERQRMKKQIFTDVCEVENCGKPVWEDEPHCIDHAREYAVKSPLDGRPISGPVPEPPINRCVFCKETNRLSAQALMDGNDIVGYAHLCEDHRKMIAAGAKMTVESKLHIPGGKENEK